tara:strand:+ start:1484 stop:1747 length:264 start_codon:yes stop_codon:yes gene_type:complete
MSKFAVTLKRFTTFGKLRSGNELYEQIDDLRKAGHCVILELDDSSHLSETMHWLSILFHAKFSTSKDMHEDARAMVTARINPVEVVE